MAFAPAAMLTHGTQICKPARAMQASQSCPPLSVKDDHTGHGQNSGDRCILRLGVDVLGGDILDVVSWW